MAPRVVVLGDANVDMVICLPDRVSVALDLTPSEPQVYGGGSAANVAVALARLGVAASFVGSVGDDGPPIDLGSIHTAEIHNRVVTALEAYLRMPRGHGHVRETDIRGPGPSDQHAVL